MGLKSWGEWKIVRYCATPQSAIYKFIRTLIGQKATHDSPHGWRGFWGRLNGLTICWHCFAIVCLFENIKHKSLIDTNCPNWPQNETNLNFWRDFVKEATVQRTIGRSTSTWRRLALTVGEPLRSSSITYEMFTRSRILWNVTNVENNILRDGCLRITWTRPTWSVSTKNRLPNIWRRAHATCAVIPY